jgi:large subunit ribosomal protein L29
MVKISELRELRNEDLEQKVLELDDQVFRLRMQKSMGQTEAANKMQGLRRDRARAKTLLRERRFDAALVELGSSAGED